MSDNTVKRTLSLPPTKPFVTTSKKLGAPPLPKLPSFRNSDKNPIKDYCPSYASTQHAYVWRVIDSSANTKNTEGLCACGHIIVE
jgi:hypothetical protein